MSDAYAGMIYGLLSLGTGMAGIVLMFQSLMVEPKSNFLFVLGTVVFVVAFAFRVLQAVYTPSIYGD